MKRISWVKAGEHGWVNIDETEFIDICEDGVGRDYYTFEYMGEVYESNIVSGSRPG